MIRKVLIALISFLVSQCLLAQNISEIEIYGSKSTRFLRISADGKVIAFGDEEQLNIFDLESKKTLHSESKIKSRTIDYKGVSYKVETNNYDENMSYLWTNWGVNFDPAGSEWMYLVRKSNGGERGEFFNYKTKQKSSLLATGFGRRGEMKCDNHWFKVDKENKEIKLFKNGKFIVEPKYSGVFLPDNTKKKNYSWLFNDSYAYFPLKTDKEKDKVFTITNLETKEVFDVSQYITNAKEITLPKGKPDKWVSVVDQSNNKFIINPTLKHYVPIPKGSSSYVLEFIKDYNVLVIGNGLFSDVYRIDGNQYNPLENVNKFLKEVGTQSVYSKYLEGFLKYNDGVITLLSFKDYSEKVIYDFRWKPDAEKEKQKEEEKLLAQKYAEEQKKKEEEAKKAITNYTNDSAESVEDPVPFPQNYVDHPLYKKAMQFTDALSWEDAEKYWIEFTKRYPDVDVGYYYSAEAKYFLAKYDAALIDFEQAYQMNPLKNRYIITYLSCIGALQMHGIGDKLGKNMGAISDPSLYQANLDELNNKIALNGSTSPYSIPLVNARTAYVNHYKKINASDKFYETTASVFGIKGKTVSEVWERCKSLKKLLENRQADPACYFYLLKDFYLFLDARPKYKGWFYPNIENELASHYYLLNNDNIYFKTYTGEVLFNQYLNNADFEKAGILIDKLIEDVVTSGLFKFKLLQLYQQKAKLLYMADRTTEFGSLAKELKIIETDYKNPIFEITTKEMLSLLYKSSDFQQAEKLAKEALSLAEKNKTGDEARLNSLLSIIYFDNGMMEKGLVYAGVKGDVDKMTPIQLFNAGSMLDDMGRLTEAEDFYLKSIEKFDKTIEGKSERIILTERAFMNPVYSSLANLYSIKGEHEKAFQIVEQTKAQALSKNLQVDKVSVKEIQALLGQDEAFVSYKIIDPSNFLIVIVTKTKVESDVRSLRQLVNPIKINFSDALLKLDTKLSQSVYQSPNYTIPTSQLKDDSQLKNGDFELMIEFYRSFLTQELGQYLPNIPEVGINNIGRMMQESMYGTFVWPFEQVIEPKQKYYLSLDGVLNFIPFETFRNENGYIAQSAEYVNITSAGILKTLKSRRYTTPRKSVIAFGGATYAMPKSSVQTVKTLSDVQEWRLKSFDLVEQNKPLTDLFTSLGYGKMTYLQGTLNEVKDIGLINTDAKIITGNEMSEKNIKTLSATGELKKYKVVHFATHGWAISSMPSVSGLAMTIPEISTDGEDGRLIANEISKLDLNADMVMLSACQTGLGKLYGGEGVMGLNQSLLKAGANSTIVSLWPVNDYATSVLVKELYKIAKENGGNYSKALLQVKRNFIAGKYNTSTMDLTHPIYWAPFVYNGQ